ncbi:ABC transporter permease [Chloroflexota bacterium]
MLAYIARRLMYTVIVIFLVSIIAFLVVQITPGDPAAQMLGPDSTPDQVEELRKELWLDRPVAVQYMHWLNNIFHGDFGYSRVQSEKVVSIIGRTLPISMYLGVLAMVISAVVGISIGIISAIRRASFLDNIISLFANSGLAVPIFWLGLMGIYLFAYKLGWLPIQGFTWPTENLKESILQTIMPVICLSVRSMAVMARQTRSSMLEVIRQDYIRTAKAKGLKEVSVNIKHALRNALIPVVTLMGTQVRILFGGAVLVETVFNIPGLGRTVVTAAFMKDFITLQAGVLMISIMTCMANLLVDISYGWLDPRTKYD